MAIPTTRTKEPGEIRIDADNCTGCGECVSVCKDFNLAIENGKAVTGSNSCFGCTGCGHCMMVCPTGAIQVFGRETSPDDLFDLPPVEESANYHQLLSLFQRRRSIREFKNKEVEPEIIEKIIRAAQTAPMGLPPSDVNLVIFDTKEKNRQLASDFCQYLYGIRWFVSNWFLALMRPFWGKSNDELFRGFVKPLFTLFVENDRAGINLVTYDAPLSVYFYGSPYCDPADPIIAATNAMYAAESLGLGSCMIGSIHPLIQNGKRARLFREKHNIRFPSREGVFVIFGYPDVRYLRGVKRTFASVTYSN